MIRMILIRSNWLLASLAIVVVVAACSPSTSGGTDELLVVASTSIVGSIVLEILGPDGRVEVLIKAGTDTHEFGPSAADMAVLASADAVVSVGLGLEGGLSDAMASVAGPVVLELGPLVSTSTRFDGTLDPHFWFAPESVAMAGREVAALLDRLAPGGPWIQRAEDLAAEMEVASAEAEEIMSGMRSRSLVTDHDFLAHFADAFGLELIGTLGEGTDAGTLASLQTLVVEHGALLVAESGTRSSLVEVLARDTGAPVVGIIVDSMGEPGLEFHSLADLLVENATRLAGG